ncbi:MAG: acylphosphatase [Erysipelotrichaceae bacterium]|nr:acylphosphatase [Erysipelotrichaceae bacterium]MDY5252591.1 acylphosphatase [Erysipelotrichaceae bacterium]
MKRYHMIVSGRVQGVGFRYFCVMNAQQLNLTGSVRNMDNGMVELFIQGLPANIDKFIAIIKQGNMFIKVDDYMIKPMPIIPNEKQFKYHY